MDTILMSVIVMSVIVHRFTPNLKGKRSRKLEEKLMLYYDDRPKMQEYFLTIVLKRRRDDRPDRDG
jgi:hypothetical protein